MRQLFIIVCLVSCLHATAQTQDVWTLEHCVQYALQHNISIQQDVLNERLSKLALQQSKLAQLPSVNASSSYGSSFGRSISPTSNQFIDQIYSFMGLSGNANVLLFGWFQQRNTIAKNKYTLEAANADLGQLRNDVSLNVATGFLRALLAQEQIHVSEKQVELSKAQLYQTRKFAESGRVPELNVAQLESQLANDSANLIGAMSSYTSSILDLKALLNLELSTPLNVVPPDVKITDQISLSTTTPEQVYEEARKHFGSIKSSELRVLAAQKNLSAMQGGLLPQLSAGVQLGSNWASNYSQLNSYTLTGYESSGFVFHQGSPTGDTVFQPAYLPHYSTMPFGRQIDNNWRQTVSLNLNIPLFNSWQGQYAIHQAKINVQTQQLNQYQTELTLKQNVYKAYNDAINSIQKYSAAQRSADAAARALDFAKKRYEMGLTNTIEYLTTQNTDYTAASNLISAKYDLIFKLKVIDYYLGKELKL